MSKLFVISGNTFFVIGGHSNFEYKLAKNRVKRAVNSNPSRGKTATSVDVPRQTVDKTYVALWESCRSIAPLQLLFLEIFKFVDNFWSFAISKRHKRNRTGDGRRRRSSQAASRARLRFGFATHRIECPPAYGCPGTSVVNLCPLVGPSVRLTRAPRLCAGSRCPGHAPVRMCARRRCACAQPTGLLTASKTSPFTSSSSLLCASARLVCFHASSSFSRAQPCAHRA
jgi:hypothetical protein